MMVTLAGRLIQFALMFMSLKLMTSWLPPVEMGRVALITTGIAFFALFLVNPVGMFFNRRMHAWFDSGNGRGYTHLYAIFILIVGFVAVLAWLGASATGLNLAQLEWRWVVALVGGSLLFNTAIQTLIPSLNMLGRQLSFTVLNVLTLITSLICSLVFCFIFGDKAEYWIAGTVMGQMIFSCFAYLVLFTNYQADSRLPRPSSDQVITAVNFCWPIAITVGLQWIHLQGYRFILADQFGLAEFGLFAVGYGLAASLVSAGETILTTWFQPTFYRAVNSHNQSERNVAWNIYAGRMLPASLLGVSALIAVSDLLPRLMLGSAYHNVGGFVVLGAIAEWGRMLVGVFGLNAHRHMATRQLIMPNAMGAFVATVGFLVCVQKFGFGISSAPISAAFGCSVVVVTLWISGKRADTHMQINIFRLSIQSFALSLFALIIERLLDSIPWHGMVATVLSLLAVGLIWLTFAILMRRDLEGHSNYGGAT